jgi:uncharacterized protein (DUF1800 family)
MDRRGLFRPLGALALGLAAGAARESRAAPPMVGADVDPGAVLDKLLSRVTYHPRAEDRAEAASLGYWGYLERQLEPGDIIDSECDARLAHFSTLGLTAAEMYTLQPPNSQAQPQRPSILVALGDLTEAALTRAFCSKRQLYERMVEFWTDHFNIDVLDQDQVFLKPLHDREAVRAYAMETFESLLMATAMSPAMLHYLDNIASTKKSPNENFARELLEIHTVSPESGYTQQDVREVARCFTGWGHYSEDPSNGTSVGTFKFDMSIHDTGAKTVMGMEIPEGGGLSDGVAVLQMLAAHPNTALHVCGKLCRWFLGEGTHGSVVAAAAAKFLDTGGDIRSVLRVILRPEHVHDAPLRYKRPFHCYVSALRATGATVTSFTESRAHIDFMGQPLFAWTPPDGYPDTVSYWGRLLQPRWRFAIYLASVANNYLGSFPGVVIDDEALFSGCETAESCVDRMDDVMFLGRMPAADRAALVGMLGVVNRNTKREALSVALGSDGFQWY